MCCSSHLLFCMMHCTRRHSSSLLASNFLLAGDTSLLEQHACVLQEIDGGARRAERTMLHNAAAHLDSHDSSNWLPPRLPAIDKVSTEEWRDSFAELQFRLHGLLDERAVNVVTPGDFDVARPLFQLARQVHRVTMWAARCLVVLLRCMIGEPSLPGVLMSMPPCTVTTQ